jgi:C4-dicarboxylate transporter DctM subunit
MSTIIIFLFIFGLILSGMPLVFALGATSVLYILLFTNVPLMIVVQRLFAGVDSFTLMCAPLFILTALLMDGAKISNRIMDLSAAIVGRMKGGLANINIVSSMFFAGISGTATADTAAIGGLLIPAMKKKGYPADFSAAITAASSTIGIIIPPSVPMIYYGVLTRQSIAELFIAGLIPGILIGLFLMIIVTFISYRKGYEASAEKWSLMRRLQALIYSWPVLGLMAIILGGIMSGIFTPTEAAGVSVVYSAFVGLVITRKIKLRDLPNILKSAAIMTGAVMVIIAVADLLGWVLTYDRIPVRLVQPFLAFQGSIPAFLWLVSFILIIAGTFLHGIALLVVLVPLFLPTVAALGIPPLQFAMVFIMCWGIGQQTPPIGSALYICCSIAGVDLWEITKRNIPFIICLLAVLALIIHFPQIVMFLPRVIR